MLPGVGLLDHCRYAVTAKRFDQGVLLPSTPDRKLINSFPSVSRQHVVVREIMPRSANFTTFMRRLLRTCLRRRESHRIASGLERSITSLGSRASL